MSAPTLLIVDDDATTCCLMARLFSGKGWSVRTAQTIATATPCLDRAPQCLVLDLMLPDGDGERLLEMIDERRMKLRVVIATGIDDQTRLAKLRHSFGPAAMFLKPVDIDALVDACGAQDRGGLGNGESSVAQTDRRGAVAP